MHSQSRNEEYIAHPSLNTSVNELVKIMADHHITELGREVERKEMSGEIIDKHIEVMSPNNESGISLIKLVSLQLTIIKLPEH